MSLFICGFVPKKSAPQGTVAQAITIDAKNVKLAGMQAEMKLEEVYPDTGSNYFKPKICADRVGLPRPPIDEFCADWMNHNIWNDESKEFDPIPLPDDSVDSMDQQNDESQHVDDKKLISKLSTDIRVAYLLLYGTESKYVDMENLSNAYDLANDDEAEAAHKAIIDALPRQPSVKSMSDEGLFRLIEAILDHSPVLTSWPNVNAFAEKYINTKPSERNVTNENSNIINEDDNKFSYKKLGEHVALSIMGINPNTATKENIKQANIIIDSVDKAWFAWNKSFRVIVGILDVDADTRHKIVTDGLKNLSLISDNDARLHFVKSALAGNPACPELENYGSKEHATDYVEKTLPEGATGDQGAIVQDEQPAHTIDGNQRQPQAVHDEFQNRAELVKADIESKDEKAKNNLSIWSQVQRTDPRFTKPLSGTGFEGTSINAEYMVMRATEIFGPMGINWGVKELKNEFISGAPMMEPIFEDKKFIGNRMLRDADGTLIFEQNHSMKILFWYVLDGVRGEIEADGATPYMYKTQKGIKCDGEAIKKSRTDAMKKALSLLGFSADVYLGYHDNAEYVAENKIEFSIKNASDKADDVVRLRKELDDKFSANTETMRTAVTKNEVEKIASALTREIGVHLDNARATGDKERESYLAGRLHRLNTIKQECINLLTEAKQAAKEAQ